MELQKRSLHMETPRLHASKQVVLEDNVIIPRINFFWIEEKLQ